jgi:uncharacterized protein YfkK (UPF0435 family)
VDFQNRLVETEDQITALESALKSAQFECRILEEQMVVQSSEREQLLQNVIELEKELEMVNQTVVENTIAIQDKDLALEKIRTELLERVVGITKDQSRVGRAHDSQVYRFRVQA